MASAEPIDLTDDVDEPFEDTYNVDEPIEDYEDTDDEDEPTEDTDVGEPIEDATDLKSQLNDCLACVDAAGSFAAFGTSAWSVNPGLYIKDLGTIGLPLSSRDAADIIKHSHQAPFGKGEDTVVDTSVRNTWEINPDQIELRNPAWKSYLDSIVLKAKQELGVPNELHVSAPLHKLLLYEEGAMFKPHKDTEKTPGMFGTLVIALASSHGGGSVKASHNGKDMLFDTASNSAYNTSWIAWYSDVKHAVLPVTAGYRLVLTFNLCRLNSTGSKQSAGYITERQNELERVLEHWKSGLNRKPSGWPTKMVHMLEHTYTQVGLQFGSLKGRDRMTVSYLREASKETGFIVLLASLERRQSGVNDPYYGCDDDVEIDMSLEDVVTLDGSKVMSSISIEDDDIVEDDPFLRGADSESDEEYTGNEGQPTSFRYHNSVAIILPKEEFLSLQYSAYSGRPTQVHTFVKNVTASVCSDPKNPRRHEDLDKICHLVARDSGFGSKYHLGAYEEILLTLLECCTLAEKVNSFKRVMASSKGDIPQGVYVALAEAIWKQGLSMYQAGLDKALSKLSNLPEYLQMLERFKDAVGPNDEFDVWRQARFEDALRSMPIATQQAVDCLVDSVRELGDPSSVAKLSISQAGLDKALSRLSNLPEYFQLLKRFKDAVGPSDEFEVWRQARFEGALRSLPIATQQDVDCLVDSVREFGGLWMVANVAPVLRQHHAHKPTFILGFLAKVFEGGLNIETSREAATNVFTDLLMAIMPSFTLHSEPVGQPPKRHRTEQGRADPTGPAINPEVGPSIAKVIGHCLYLNLHSQITSIFRSMQNDAKKLSAQEYRGVVFPFLQELLKVMKEQKVSMDTAEYQSLFQTLLSSGIQICVSKEPDKAKDWSRPNHGCPRRCNDCDELGQFLSDPLTETVHFKWSPGRLEHIEGQLFRNCRKQWTKSLELIVSKTQEEWGTRRSDWDLYEFTPMRTTMENLGDHEDLRTLLADRYDELANLRAVRLPEGQLRWDNVQPVVEGTGFVLTTNGNRVYGSQPYLVDHPSSGLSGLSILSIKRWQLNRQQQATAVQQQPSTQGAYGQPQNSAHRPMPGVPAFAQVQGNIRGHPHAAPTRGPSYVASAFGQPQNNQTRAMPIPNAPVVGQFLNGTNQPPGGPSPENQHTGRHLPPPPLAPKPALGYPAFVPRPDMIAPDTMRQISPLQVNPNLPAALPPISSQPKRKRDDEGIGGKENNIVDMTGDSD